jgi:hypothetical protein
MVVSLAVPRVRAQGAAIVRPSLLAAAASAAGTVLWFAAPPADAAVTFDDIHLWTGTGSNRAALVIDFNDAATPQSYVWGYRWDGTATGEDMFRAVVTADPRLFAKRKAFSWGTANLGIGYDADGDGFAISDGTMFGAGGIAAGSETAADGATALDPDDRYREGWHSGFFGYYVAGVNPYAGGTWAESQVGGGDRALADGAWDGLSFAPNFSQSVPDEPVAAVPEPAAAGAVVVLGGLLLARRRRCRRAEGGGQ